jgi:hypothetical protein
MNKTNNPVAKHSRNNSGAGPHKSKKEYDRKEGKVDMETMEDELESWASKIDRIVLLTKMQKNCNNPNAWFDYEERIHEVKLELEAWQTTE